MPDQCHKSAMIYHPRWVTVLQTRASGLALLGSARQTTHTHAFSALLLFICVWRKASLLFLLIFRVKFVNKRLAFPHDLFFLGLYNSMVIMLCEHLSLCLLFHSCDLKGNEAFYNTDTHTLYLWLEWVRQWFGEIGFLTRLLCEVAIMCCRGDKRERRVMWCVLLRKNRGMNRAIKRVSLYNN